MKSKLFLPMIIMVVALSLTAAANAQERSGSTSGIIQKTKVDLPCSVTQMSTDILGIKMTNNTGAWLPQGKTIYYEAKGAAGYQIPNGAGKEVIFVNGKKVLDGMVPPSNSKILTEVMASGSQLVSFPYSCTAWYFK